MDIREFYDMLDMETASDFAYFENMAELLESEVPVEDDLIYMLLREVDLDLFGDLFEEYFKEIEPFIPEEENEFYLLVDNIRESVAGMIGEAQAAPPEDSETMILRLASEVGKLRSWYSGKDSVLVTRDGEGSRRLPVRDAISEVRGNKILGGETRFDFSEALDYELPDQVYMVRGEN